MTKKILVIGNGGREHAIVDALARSPQKPDLYNFGTARNPGIAKLCKEVFVGNILDRDEIKLVASSIQPDFAVVGPDDPISIGAVDALKEVGVPAFAPTAKCGQLESSKGFTRNLLKKYNIDVSPDFLVSTNSQDQKSRENFYQKFEGKIVVKADGLLGGKGVIVADEHFSSFDEAENFAKKSIEKFERVVLEEKLIGEEFSLMCLVDGETVLDTTIIQDHKRAFENDTGPQTGGMGCLSDENLTLPFFTEKDKQEAHDITVRTMKAIEAELGEKFVGVMYGGFIVTKRGLKLIEYNARFGDPEALNIFPLLKNDFVEVCEKAIAGKLSEIGELEFEQKATVVKYLCPEGYPTNPVKNEEVKISREISEIEKYGKVYFASVGEENGKILLKGSRGIGVVGIGNSLEEASEKAEEMIKSFSGPLFYRKDIGTKALLQKRIDNMKKIR